MSGQQSREELLAMGRKKLQLFQQSRSRGGDSEAANHVAGPALSAASQPPSASSTSTPRRDLLPFLDAAGATSEPTTPPSTDFTARTAAFEHSESGGSREAAASPKAAHSTVSLSLIAATAAAAAAASSSASSFTASASEGYSVEPNPYAPPAASFSPHDGLRPRQPLQNGSLSSSVTAPALASPSSAAAAAFSSPSLPQASSLALASDSAAALGSHSQSDRAEAEAAAAPSAASASYDAAAVQYYQDEAGNIFYYDESGQPVYCSAAEYAGGDDVSALREKVSAYERYVSELQASLLLSSSSSPLPALQSLSHELEQAQAENGRLQSLLGSLQSRLAAQAGQVTELMEDNCRLVQEYEEICEQLNGHDDRRRIREAELHETHDLQLRDRQQGSERGEERDEAGGCRHEDTLQLLSSDAAHMEKVLHDGRQLMDGLSRHWTRIVQQLHSVAAGAAAAPAFSPPPQPEPLPEGAETNKVQQAAGGSGNYGGGAAVVAEIEQAAVQALDWSLTLQETAIFSSLLARKDDSEHQLSMLLSHTRRLLDPVALLLSPPASIGPLLLLPPASVTSTTTIDPSSSSSSSSSLSPSPSPSQVAELQSARFSLQEQLQAQQERAAALIRDKVLLAKRIELVHEEKQLMEAMLREALEQAGTEKESYRRRLEQLMKQAATGAQSVAAGQQTATTGRRRTKAEEQPADELQEEGEEHHHGDRRNGLLPLPPHHRQQHSRPAALLAASPSVHVAASVAANGLGLRSTRPQHLRRRKEADSGLLSSLWAFLFGSGQAALSDEDVALTAAGDMEAGRVLSV